MEESTVQTKWQTFLNDLCLRQFVPEDWFYQEFNNRVQRSKTLLCFGLGKHSKVLWDIWGYTYNKPNYDHAEILALRAIEDFFKQRQQDKSEKYELTIYLSFSPCAKCAKSLAAFVRSQSAVQVNIMVSRLYFPQDNNTQKNLRDMVLSGVKLRVMAREDFKKCYYLFVNYCGNFEEWPELEQKSDNLSTALQAILHQREKHSSPESYDSDSSTGLPRTPLHVGPSGPLREWQETPQKAASVARDTSCVQGVRKKLFDED